MRGLLTPHKGATVGLQLFRDDSKRGMETFGRKTVRGRETLAQRASLTGLLDDFFNGLDMLDPHELLIQPAVEIRETVGVHPHLV